MPKLFTQIKAQKQLNRHAALQRELIRREAKIGGELFGPLRTNGRRDFFCLDRHTWVWHEEWDDQYGQHHIVTTNYDIRPNGIIKAQNGQNYSYLTANEAQNLYKAVMLYKERVFSELYGLAES